MFQNISHSIHESQFFLLTSNSARRRLAGINNSGFRCDELANSIQDGCFLDSKYTTTATEDQQAAATLAQIWEPTSSLDFSTFWIREDLLEYVWLEQEKCVSSINQYVSTTICQGQYVYMSM